MGMRVETTAGCVPWPRRMRDRATEKAGSSVLTVCVSEIATAAKERLAAMWPTACIEAGQKMRPNSSLVTICVKLGCLKPNFYRAKTQHTQGQCIKKNALESIHD